MGTTGIDQAALTAALAVRGGIATAAQLAAALGISQPTFSRLVSKASEVIMLGHGRAAQYALLRSVRALGSRFPVFRITPEGCAEACGNLFTLHGGRMLLAAADGTQTVFDGLPWFLDDMRPQGFLGRLFAREAAALGVPADPREWTDDDVLVALSQNGADCVGNLLIGDDALARFLAGAVQGRPPVRRNDYPALALALLQGGAPGSSAGGEQPKFACVQAESGGEGRHLLVKFSPPLDAGRPAERWGDLLVCEHLALDTLRQAGMPAAASAVVESGGRIMLEVERFDRTAAGRIGTVSGAAVEAQFVGGATTWTRLGAALAADGRLSAADADRLAGMELFGAMIGNSDMHLGNLSFFTEGRFALAPCYDMLPMRYAPAGRGEVLAALPPAMPPFSYGNRVLWREAARWATDFWQAVAAEPRLGGRMTEIATAALAAIAEAQARCELLV